MDNIKNNSYIRTKNGNIYKGVILEDEKVKVSSGNDDFISIEEVTNSSNTIESILEENDLVEVEFYSLRYDKRVTRIFAVENKIERGYFRLVNSHMDFLIRNNIWSDIELNPIIKGIITRELIDKIKINLDIDVIVNKNTNEKSI